MYDSTDNMPGVTDESSKKQHSKNNPKRLRQLHSKSSGKEGDKDDEVPSKKAVASTEEEDNIVHLETAKMEATSLPLNVKMEISSDSVFDSAVTLESSEKDSRVLVKCDEAEKLFDRDDPSDEGELHSSHENVRSFTSTTLNLNKSF